jgi:large subunit ribosomal protein L47
MIAKQRSCCQHLKHEENGNDHHQSKQIFSFSLNNHLCKRKNFHKQQTQSMLKRFIINTTTNRTNIARITNTSTTAPIIAPCTTRSIHWNTSASSTMNRELPQRGLEEFVDRTLFEGKKLETSGRAWKVTELRRKSHSDLQKLWFVLYKERNMLLTMKRVAKLMNGKMHHPERMKKVAQSMARIKTIVRERQLEAQQLAKAEFARNKALNNYQWPPEKSADYEEVVNGNPALFEALRAAEAEVQADSTTTQQQQQ